MMYAFLIRLEKQVSYLDRHPEIALIGSNYIVIDSDGNMIQNSQCLETPCQIRWKLFFGNQLAHPTIMMRRSIFSQVGFRYDEQLLAAQDYDLWIRISGSHLIANIPEALLFYRKHPNSISNVLGTNQRDNDQNIIIKNIYKHTTIKLTDVMYIY